MRNFFIEKTNIPILRLPKRILAETELFKSLVIRKKGKRKQKSNNPDSLFMNGHLIGREIGRVMEKKLPLSLLLLLFFAFGDKDDVCFQSKRGKLLKLS